MKLNLSGCRMDRRNRLANTFCYAGGSGIVTKLLREAKQIRQVNFTINALGEKQEIVVFNAKSQFSTYTTHHWSIVFFTTIQ